jgi:hypothetical protein
MQNRAREQAEQVRSCHRAAHAYDGKMRPLVRLISWSAEAPEHVRKLKAFRVDASLLDSSRVIGRIAEMAPAAVVIDLDRKPSHGKAVGVVLTKSKSTRAIPLVFAGGPQEKAAHIQGDLPGAVFTTWAKAAAAVKRAIANPPVTTAPAKSYMEQWAGRTLAKKLDLKAGMRVALLGAPDGFTELLGDPPEGLEFHAQIGRGVATVIWFVHSAAELEEFDFMSARLTDGVAFWVMHPKVSGNLRADFNQIDVRRAAKRVGMIDYKVCSVDEDWSALKIGRRKN